MNHRVQVFISGCLTLKFSGSWKTVICSSSLYSFLTPFAPFGAAFSSFTAPFVFPPSGEMGMVSSGTGETALALPLVAGRSSRVAMMR